jgi:dienelactone hydrolase
MTAKTISQEEVLLRAGPVLLAGTLALPENALGLVLFAHGSGSSRFSSRNRHVAEVLNERGLATLLFDLLTEEEQIADEQTLHLRFDIRLLAGRLVAAIDWARQRPGLGALPLGLFGASTGAAAALVAAAARPEAIVAVVSRGGRPDLAGDALGRVRAPTLLIVGSRDAPVVEMNRQAAEILQAEHRLEIVPGASHLFEEPGTLARVARLAADWFAEHLAPPGGSGV